VRPIIVVIDCIVSVFGSFWSLINFLDDWITNIAKIISSLLGARIIYLKEIRLGPFIKAICLIVGFLNTWDWSI
jgi:hypothetical protein